MSFVPVFKCWKSGGTKIEIEESNGRMFQSLHRSLAEQVDFSSNAEYGTAVPSLSRWLTKGEVSHLNKVEKQNKLLILGIFFPTLNSHLFSVSQHRNTVCNYNLTILYYRFMLWPSVLIHSALFMKDHVFAISLVMIDGSNTTIPMILHQHCPGEEWKDEEKPVRGAN